MLDHPLRPIVSQWREKIRLSAQHKQKQFTDDASEAMRFYNGPHNFLYGPPSSSKTRTNFTDDEMLPPSFRMTVNKASEVVQIFGPVLYHKNPIRKVNPRKPPMLPIEVFGPPDDPMVQQQFLATKAQVDQVRATDAARASLLEFYLNYTPNALGLKDHARSAIDEALIKGMGVLVTETFQPKGMDMTLVGSFYDTVDNWFIDPDCESLREAQWIARRCIHPCWMVERDYNLPPRTLKGSLQSYSRQSEDVVDEDADMNRKRGLSNDLCCYWKIFSKMGVGARLAGVPYALRETLEQFGDYCFLVICDECPYPLNLPPGLTEGVTDPNVWLDALQWPTPFWADDEWPITPIAFHWVPRQVWPMSHLKPAMGELKFLDWCYSFLAQKIKTACRDFLVVQKSAGEELKHILLHGCDYTLLEIEKHHGTISDVVQFLNHPQFNGDIYRVLQAVEHNFEKRTGLTELAYGESARQLRSASEAEIKSDSMKVRPDDMSSRVEEAMTIVARKEALAARWHLEAKDVAPVMGPMGAQWWQQLLEPSDPAEILYSLEYRIEAGSARKPNKERDVANMQAAMQTVFAPLFQYGMQTGNIGPINKLLADWAKSIDLEGEGYLLQPPPPPPPPPMPSEGQPGPPPEQAPQ